MGMTPAEATTAYREPLAPNSPLQDERDCYHLFPGGRVGPVAFMVYEGLVVRVEVTGPGVLTEDGVGVGSLESEVEEAYSSKAVVSPHKYTGPKGHYLTVAGDESLQLVFETDGTRVTEFRAGKLPEVGWVEGCQ